MALQPVVDTKLIGRPPQGVENEASWPAWSSVTTAYIQAIDGRYSDLLKRAADLSQDFENSSLTAEEQQLSTQLFFILLMLCTKGRTVNKSLLAGQGEGLKRWRLILQEYEPQYKSRVASMCQKVMGYVLDDGLAWIS